jgi:tetratricopeptide (TPR) repeat protein
MRPLVCLLIGGLLAGCSARQLAAPPPPPPLDISAADALFHAGCYRCLTDAYALYERARTFVTPHPDARSKAFSTALLLALREKEIDLDATPWIDRARSLALPDEGMYLDLVAGVPWNGGAIPDFEPETRVTPVALDDWRQTLQLRRHIELDTYLLLTLECLLGTRASIAEALRTLDTTPPMMQFRAGLCRAEERPKLEALVAADPRFVEAWYFIGRYEMSSGVNAAGSAAGRRWLTTAVRPLTLAHEGVPEAPTLAAVLASLMRARSDLPRALALYDLALMRRPTHADAMLGRTVTLSYLKQYDEAVAAASRIIALGRGHLASAHYYRAWNHYQKRDLDAVVADVIVARRLRAPEEVLVLSGLVAYDQKRVLDARRDFTEAVTGNPLRCTAHWYLGILDLDDQLFASALSTFGQAADCYLTAAESLRREMAQLPDDLPEEIRAAQSAALGDEVAVNNRQAGRASFNAAQAAMRVKDHAAALRHAKRASNYEEMRERAEAIIATLER